MYKKARIVRIRTNRIQNHTVDRHDLYIVIKRAVKIGDYIVNGESSSIHLIEDKFDVSFANSTLGTVKNLGKVIASTDPELNMTYIPKDLISNFYTDGKSKIWVKLNSDYTPKLDDKKLLFKNNYLSDNKGVRYQDLKPLGKLWRLRFYLEIPFKYTYYSYFKDFKVGIDEIVDGKFIHSDKHDVMHGEELFNLLVGIAQGKMKWFYTWEEVKNKLDKKFKEKD